MTKQPRVFISRDLEGRRRADEQTSIAETISIPQGEEAEAHLRPAQLGTAYHEQEYDQLAEQQVQLWAAKGEGDSRDDAVVAASLTTRKDVVGEMLDEARSDVAEAKGERTVTRTALRGLAHRGAHAKIKYWLTYGALLGGDLAGVAGAAIAYGELPSLAIVQATSSAAAAVTAGVVGHDIAVARQARRRMRDPQSLTTEQAAFRHLFTGGDVGERVVRAMIVLAVTLTLLVVGAVATLRTAAYESTVSGFVFGCLAGAIAAASGLNAYHFADEISDLIDRAERKVTTALKKLNRLSLDPSLGGYSAATARMASIKQECSARGFAAARKILALKHAISRLNPQVMGHGHRAEVEQLVMFPEHAFDTTVLPTTTMNGRHR